ncbi:MAG: helix-turn-helix transcriptional regulator [Planctomycetota bacterium]|jgi:predicted ArsR family transcriptional regulator
MPETGVSMAGMRIVKLLVGNRPQTVADLIKSTGVTRTAVTEQLNELVAAGYVERTTERLSGRGRPRHRFAATEASLELLFSGNQHLVVPAMWEAIADVGGSAMKRKVLRRVSRIMADHYKPRITAKTPRERMVQMAGLLREEGCLVDVEEDNAGHLVVRRLSCPFISMFEETRTVCCVDQEVMSLVVGGKVRRKASRHDGAPCCQFVLNSAKRK